LKKQIAATMYQYIKTETMTLERKKYDCGVAF